MSRIDEIVEILSQYFAVSQEAIISSTFYKNYAVYLSRKYTPLSNTEIGRYFGGISYSAVTKIGTRLKHRIEEDDSLRQEMDRIEAEMSRVKG
jgi:chromosomal replication initiation ATPase DnaA